MTALGSRRPRIVRCDVTLRVLYLTTSLGINGREAFRGRRLFDSLSAVSEVAVVGHQVWGPELNDTTVPSDLVDDVVRHSVLEELRPNVVYLEGGLRSIPSGGGAFGVHSSSRSCETVRSRSSLTRTKGC